MNITLGLFALSLLGADGPRPLEDSPIAYNVRFLKVKGLDWRGTYFSRLQPVTTQVGTSVWTSDRETADRIGALDPTVVRAPRVTSMPQAAVVVHDRAIRKVASGITRLADGPFDHATKVAYTPNYQAVNEGSMVTMAGRRIDQGVLACVVVDETRVAAVHRVTLTESLATKDCCETGCEKLAPNLEVPEIAHASVAGEWLIPNDGALVVSLGVQTAADAEGKAVVTERLVLIEARPLTDGALKQASLTRDLLPDFLPPGTAVVAPSVPMPMPMPMMPSRSMPQAMSADGTPMALPPLPENPPAPSSLPGSSEPCATPQMPHPKPATATPDHDAASTQAGFFTHSAEKDRGRAAASGDADRPIRLRLPWKAGAMSVEFEFRLPTPSGKAAATPRPEE